MKEILEALGSRLTSPLFGYTFFAFIAINWKPLFYVVVSSEEVAVRIKYFEEHADLYSLLIYPIAFSMIAAVAYPWVKFVFLYLNKRPTVLRNTLQAESEHATLLKKQQLEKLRSDVLAEKESELIERAKRDIELENIEDEKIRDKLKQEIESLRSERNNISHAGGSRMDHLKELAKNYSSQAVLAKQKGELDQAEALLYKAMEIQEMLIAESEKYEPNK